MTIWVTTYRKVDPPVLTDTGFSEWVEHEQTAWATLPLEIIQKAVADGLKVEIEP